MNEGQRNIKLLPMRLGKVDPIAGEMLRHRVCSTKQRKATGSDGHVAVLKLL